MSRTTSHKFEQTTHVGHPSRPMVPEPHRTTADPGQRQPLTGNDNANTTKRRTPRRGRWRWIVGALVSATVGVAAFLVGGFEYRASAELTVTNATAPASMLDDLRRDLLDHSWQMLSASTSRWRIDLDEDARTLRVILAAPDPDQAHVWVTELTTTFMKRIRTAVECARTEPGPGEAIFSEFRHNLRSELATLTGDVRRIESALPREDCQETDVALRRQLVARRDAYQRNRRLVDEATTQLAAITNAPIPTRATVDPEIRSRSIGAEVELQQDFKALHVQLAEARYQLLKVWETASPALENVSAFAERLETLCSCKQVRSADLKLRRVAERIAQSTADYRAFLTEFSNTWMAEFGRLRTLRDDPRRAEVIEIQAAIANAVSRFVFQSSVPLAAIRQEVGTAPTTSAGQHEFASSLVRTFHTFQTAHHRFEFAAADVKSSNNFRLDAALKSAKGLRYRSRKRLARIEERLSREALEHLRVERTKHIAALENKITEQRKQLDAALDAAWVTQDRANEHASTLRSFLQSKTVAGICEERAKDIKAELQQIEIRLNDLAAKRMNVINPDHIEVTPCRVDRWPANLRTKLLQGVLAGIASLVFLIGLRMWLSPKAM